MKLNAKETAMLVGIGTLQGRCYEYTNHQSTESDLDRKFWVSMAAINPWYSGYYLGYDKGNGNYVVEWWNLDMSHDGEDETVISMHPGMYLEDDAKMLVKAIKRHKKTKE